MKKKIRTEENLQDALDEEFAWRLKEISTIKTLIRKSNERKSESSERAIIRSGIALLYAHWEGFVKKSSLDYLEFVLAQNLNYQDLRVNFVALGLKSLINNALESKKIRSHIEVSNFFINDLNTKCEIQIKKAIDTESNLSSRVLHEIITSVGIDYSPFATKEILIDESLVSTRNSVAHGEYLLMDSGQFLDMCDEILCLLDIFKNQISNAAATKQYIRVK